jgi:DNA-binding MarR family transcriptional regulator
LTIPLTQLRDSLGLTNGNLSRHLQVLEHAGYIRIDKVFVGRRPHTCVAASKTGRDAFRVEVGVLTTLMDRFAPDKP